MSLFLKIIPHTLRFKFDARTSRGAMLQHQVYFFKLYDPAHEQLYGLGECAPLPGLSFEHSPTFGDTIYSLQHNLNNKFNYQTLNTLEPFIYNEEMAAYPSVVFALETAYLDLISGGDRKLFANNFTQEKAGIPINGLIWMGDKGFMQEQIIKKLNEGYSCLKLKIGGLDFNTELDILAAIRKVAPASDLIIRLDANGAFSPAEALFKLEKLSAFSIHSIEQPIKQGQWPEMRKLCLHSPIPVALDEELISINKAAQKQELLDAIQPPYIILKPTLVGGLKATADWISLAQERNVGWWITSALESNIGLNAISQFTAQYPIEREQGLGTGQLYHNNIPSPLTISMGKLFYDKDSFWDLSLFNS